MERLPPTSFGRTLRTLVRERFGNQGELAKHLGVDASWITKVVRGSQEGLSYASLQRILEAFCVPSDKELLYEAWRETFAPSPLSQAPSSWDDEESIARYCGQVHELISAGRALAAFRSLQPIWSALQGLPSRSELALTAGHSLIDAANQLDRPEVSLAVADRMQEIALSRREPGWMATTLGLMSVSLRHLRPRRLPLAESSFQKFGAYLAAWQPVSLEARSRKQSLARAYARDHLLVGLDGVREGGLQASQLTPRINHLETQAKGAPEGQELGLASEVLSRALIVSGHIDQAAKALGVARKNVSSRGNEIKVLICKAQLYLADGQLDEAEALLDRAANFADEWSLVHHRHKIAEISRDLSAMRPDRYILQRIRKE